MALRKSVQRALSITPASCQASLPIGMAFMGHWPLQRGVSPLQSWKPWVCDSGVTNPSHPSLESCCSRNPHSKFHKAPFPGPVPWHPPDRDQADPQCTTPLQIPDMWLQWLRLTQNCSSRQHPCLAGTRPPPCGRHQHWLLHPALVGEVCPSYGNLGGEPQMHLHC